MNYDTFRIAQNGQRLIVGNFDEPFLIQKIKETEYHKKVTQKTAYRSFNGHNRRFGGDNDVLREKSRHNRRNLAGQHSRRAR